MLKSQDVVIALKIALSADAPWTQSQLAYELGMSASEVNAGIRRGIACELLHRDRDTRKVLVLRHNLLEFVLHGLRYVFPAERGAPARGLATGVALDKFRSLLVRSSDPPPVWPDTNGRTRGYTLKPLYPSVPFAAQRDEKLYEVLAMIDALRDGLGAERETAAVEISRLLSPAT
ncbi:MAG: hypothetical protein AAFN78_19000 [Pseudomonadota bacterium]